MESSINKLFKNLKDAEPRDLLSKRILSAVARERRARTRQKLMLSYSGMAVSLVALAYAIPVFGNTLVKSDFWSVVSLAYSDAGILWGHWNSFLYSLLETFPVIDVIALLIPVFTLCLSLAAFAKFINLKYIHGV